MAANPSTAARPAAPDADEVDRFRTPAGRVWNRLATPLSPGGDQTNDNGCVAVAYRRDGHVVIADTKRDLDAQDPLVFLPVEWQNFTTAVREGRI